MGQVGDLHKILGNVPPQAVDLEKTVLAAIMLERDAIHEVIHILSADMFYEETNSKIYEAILSLFKSGDPIDIMTVVNKLRVLGTLEIAGGASNIAEITTRVNSSANIVYHSRIIVEKHLRRSLIRVFGKNQDAAYDETIDVFDMLSKSQSDLSDIANISTRGDYRNISQSIMDTYKHMNDIVDMEITGLPTGMKSVDEKTGGFQNGDLIIIAARPSMGKTAYVITIAKNLAEMGKSVGVFSMEMSTRQLEQRLISSESDVSLARIRTPKYMSQHEWDRVNMSIDMLQGYKISIDDTPGLTIIELRAKARKMKRVEGIDLLIVDYLQLMSGPEKQREQEISAISRGLKAIAKDLDIPVIALSQLSRAVEARGGNKKPMLSDLRESGSIEQDADMVQFLYRPEYYGFEVDESGNSTIGQGEVITAKNRQGALGTSYLSFVGQTTTWKDL